jgi:CBS domain-containing membrane protein
MTVKARRHNGATNFAHVELLLERLRLPFLLRHLPAKLVWTTYVCINGFISIALLALLAELSGSPFVFPSLGPTAYLFFFSPLAEVSSPRNTILGHAVGLVCGYGAFYLTGMHTFSQATGATIYWPRILSAALALSATGAFMVLLSVSHPPAGATTLIVALGILAKPRYLVVIEIAVILLTVQAWVFNHMAGLPYPKWHALPPRDSPQP